MKCFFNFKLCPTTLQISTKKVNKTIAILRKLQNILPRPALLTIYKYFVRTHLYYGNIIYDQGFNSSSHQKFESPLQYYAADFSYQSVIRETAWEKNYQR